MPSTQYRVPSPPIAHNRAVSTQDAGVTFPASALVRDRLACDTMPKKLMTTPTLPTSLEPTQDERTMATLAHALQIIGSWIAPLVIFLIRRESRFVAFHALQALLLQILHVIAIVIFVFVWFGLIFSMIFHQVGAK